MRSFVVFIAVLAVALAVPMQDSGESGEAEAEWAMAEGEIKAGSIETHSATDGIFTRWSW